MNAGDGAIICVNYYNDIETLSSIAGGSNGTWSLYKNPTTSTGGHVLEQDCFKRLAASGDISQTLTVTFGGSSGSTYTTAGMATFTGIVGSNFVDCATQNPGTGATWSNLTTGCTASQTGDIQLDTATENDNSNSGISFTAGSDATQFLAAGSFTYPVSIGGTQTLSGTSIGAVTATWNFRLGIRWRHDADQLARPGRRRRLRQPHRLRRLLLPPHRRQRRARWLRRCRRRYRSIELA